MNVKVAQYLLPKLLKAGKGSTCLAQRAAYTIFNTPQTAKTSSSIFSRVANKTCQAAKQTAKKTITKIKTSDTYNATKAYAGKALTTAANKITNSTAYQKTGKMLGKLKSTITESKLFKGAIKKARKGIAWGCKKNKTVRETYGEMYFASKAYTVAKQSVKYEGPLKGLVSNGAGAWSFAKEVGPIPFATGIAGAVGVPAPGTAELGLFLGLLAKRGLTKASNKIVNFTESCFLTLVK